MALVLVRFSREGIGLIAAKKSLITPGIGDEFWLMIKGWTLALSASLLVLAWTGSAHPNDLVVRVGLGSTRTGANAVAGNNGRLGIQAMVNWVNAGNVPLRKGRILKIQLVDKGDDGSNIQVARQFYQELVRDRSIDFLVGPYGSEAAAVVHPLAEASHKLILAPFAASDALFSDRARWRVQVVPPASTYFDTLVELLAMAPTAQLPLTVVLPAESDPFAESANAFTRSHLDAYGAGIFSVLFDSGRTRCASVPGGDQPCFYPATGGLAGMLEDWVDQDLIPATRASLNNVAILSSGHSADGVRFAKKLNALGLNPKVLAMTIAPSSGTFFQNVGPYARGIIGNTAWHEPQEIFTAANTPKGFEYFGPNHGEASLRIRALNGNVMPTYHAGSGGLAILLLARAIQITEGDKSEEQVRHTVHKLRLQTCFGQYAVKESTGLQTAGRMLMVQWHTPDDEPALPGPALRVIAAPANLPSVLLSPFVYPKP